MCLRPEGTAGVVRALVQSGALTTAALGAVASDAGAAARPVSPHPRVTYFGPMFRHEHPQHGRLRQFRQIGVELFGGVAARATGQPAAAGPQARERRRQACALDVEAIVSARRVLSELGVLERCTLHLHTLGSRDEMAAYADALTEYLRGCVNQLSPLSQERVSQGHVLRVLDSKDANDRAVVERAPRILDLASSDTRGAFEEVQRSLRALDVPFLVDHTLVRGLDYYVGTVFEFVLDSNAPHAALADAQQGGQRPRPTAQAGLAVLGGGRYDGLVRQMGGADVPGIGWAAGVERITEVMRAIEKDAGAAPGTPDPCVAIGVLRPSGRTRSPRTNESYGGEHDDTAAAAKAKAKAKAEEEEEEEEKLSADMFRFGSVLGERVRSGSSDAPAVPGVQVGAVQTAKKMKPLLARLTSTRANVAVVIAEDEFRQGKVIVKNLALREQTIVPVEQAVTAVNAVLASRQPR